MSNQGIASLKLGESVVMAAFIDFKITYRAGSKKEVLDLKAKSKSDAIYEFEKITSLPATKIVEIETNGADLHSYFG